MKTSEPGRAAPDNAAANAPQTADPAAPAENRGDTPRLADLLIPTKKRMWSKVEPPKGGKKTKKRGQRADKTFELKERECEQINAALSDEATVSKAKVLVGGTDDQISFQGVVPGYAGFQVSSYDAKTMIRLQQDCSRVIKPWMIGRDVLTGDGSPTRLIIDFADMDMSQAQSFGPAFVYLKERVLPEIIRSAEHAKGDMKAAREEHLARWWQFWNVRVEMRSAFASLTRYIACSRVTKRPIFAFVSTMIVPDGALQTWALDDDYSFGIIQSSAHAEWFFANCSKLKSDYRYTRRSVWDTFPWPQSPTPDAIKTVATAAREVRRAREATLRSIEGGLRAVYRFLELPGKHPLKDAHAVLDTAVAEAYGFNSRVPFLDQLLQLNYKVSARNVAGLPTTGAGIPAGCPSRVSLITQDCIVPEQ